MQRPNLTPDQIQQRCTAQSFIRGTRYFHAGAIGNPVLHGWTLSATCDGTDVRPYRVSVELMPTGIAATHCSCPYDGDGDCKHSVALLLTYVHTPEHIDAIDALITTLAEKPKENLLRILSELLKRTPSLAPVVRVYADTFDAPEPAPTTFAVYRERIDRIFGPGFLEQHQLQKVLIQLEGLVQHAESLSERGETEFALSLLHALIHQSTVRYPDTLQQQELPRFVKKCTKTFVQIATNTQESDAIREHTQLLLERSFDAAPVFTPLLTHLLEQCCGIEGAADLQATLEKRLNESPDRQAHVQLLSALYCQSGRIGACLRLARREGDPYGLIHTLFTRQQDAAAWRALETQTLCVDEYWCLLESPIAVRIQGFADKLLLCVRHHDPDTAIALYHRLIEKTALSGRRAGYEKTRDYLTDLRTLYTQGGRENQWAPYLTRFQKQHARKRLLLRIIDVQHTA